MRPPPTLPKERAAAPTPAPLVSRDMRPAKEILRPNKIIYWKKRFGQDGMMEACENTVIVDGDADGADHGDDDDDDDDGGGDDDDDDDDEYMYQDSTC
jgi:hypothetical protein